MVGAIGGLVSTGADAANALIVRGEWTNKDTVNLLSNILLYINTLTKYIFVDIVYATFTRIGCNTTPSIPSANAFGNTFFIICILPFTSALIFMPLLLTNNPL